MKHTLILGLALALATSALFACGSGNDAAAVTSDAGTQTSSPSAETTADYLESLGARDFKGAAFKTLDANDHPELFINVTPEELDGEPLNDALYTRDHMIMDKYNTALKYTLISNGAEGMNAYRKTAISGEHAYDRIISTINGGRLETAATDGLLFNLCKMPYLTLDANWWSGLMYENLRMNGSMYYTTGDISTVMYTSPFCIYYNQNMGFDYGFKAQELYDAVDGGSWTLDKMTAMAKGISADLNADGGFTLDDRFGFIMQNNRLSSNGLLVGAGCSMIELTEGGVRFDGLTEGLLNVIEKAKLVYEPVVYKEQNDIISKTFKEGRALFLAHLLESGQRLRDMENDYSILPMPKYDETQKSYRSLVNGWTDSFQSVPLLADTELAGFLMEAMAYESYRTIRPQAVDVFFKAKVARDESSARMIDIIYNTMYMDFNTLYDFGGSCTAISESIFKRSETASALAAIAGKTTAAIDKLNESWK